MYSFIITLSMHSLNTLDFSVSQAVAKIFDTRVKDCINQIRFACDLPDVNVMTERCRMKFVNNMLDVIICVVFLPYFV